MSGGHSKLQRLVLQALEQAHGKRYVYPASKLERGLSDDFCTVTTTATCSARGGCGETKTAPFVAIRGRGGLLRPAYRPLCADCAWAHRRRTCDRLRRNREETWWRPQGTGWLPLVDLPTARVNSRAWLPFVQVPAARFDQREETRLAVFKLRDEGLVETLTGGWHDRYYFSHTWVRLRVKVEPV